MKTNYLDANRRVGSIAPVTSSCSRHGRWRWAGLGAFWLLLAGCVPVALSPFYLEKDIIQDPALVGVWKESTDSKESWKFEAGKEQSYKVTITDDEGSAPFVARLFKLGEQRFLDLCPGPDAFEGLKRPGMFYVSLIPGHVVFRVDQIQPQLRMHVLKEDWTREWLDSHPDALDHRIVGEGKEARVVLTASTTALQQFLKQHLATTNAWAESKPLEKAER